MSNHINPNSNRHNPFNDIYEDPTYNSFEPPRFPRIVDIELTNHCNMNCWFCCQQSMTRPKGFMEDEIFAKVAVECAFWKSAIRFIRWGEPFLHKDIFKYIYLAKSLSIPVHITTNGFLVDGKKAGEILRCDLDSIIFSFQGVSVEGYMEMRNASREVATKVFDNLCNLVKLRGKREKPYIQATTTITDETEEYVDVFINHWFEVGVDAVGVGKTNLHRVSNDKTKELVPQETISLEHFRCTEVYQKLSVDWDGKVSCCCGDPDNYMTIGDISNPKETLYVTWVDSKQLKLIRALLENNGHRALSLCKDCYLTHDWRKGEENEV